jgi:hypothetical protein
MGFFGDNSDEATAYDQVNTSFHSSRSVLNSSQFATGKVHKSDISHELLAGAASFAAAKEFEKHCEANGKPQSHAEAKELL